MRSLLFDSLHGFLHDFLSVSILDLFSLRLWFCVASSLPSFLSTLLHEKKVLTAYKRRLKTIMRAETASKSYANSFSFGG